MPVNTPAEVVDPLAAVAAAENEASSLDILVCGNCQAVFHYIQEFQEHKIKNDCEKADKTSLNLQGNKKPQVWAFLIWKNSQQKAADQQGSWKLYQKWCNMPETQRQSWVTAGRNIQAFINLSHARELNKVDITNKDTDHDIDDEQEEDFVVEKIVGKRYNPKKKQVEYLLKWEGYPSEQNTWEPLSNLTTCKSLLQEYERTAAQQLNNDKSSVTRFPGLLKKDSASPPVKLQNANTNKPAGVIPNRITAVEKKNEPATPTLQTQRKIVPVTPLTNNITPSKIAIPITPVVRAEAPKLADTVKSANAADTATEASKVPKSPLSSTPFKKRVIPASKESPPLITSPEKNLNKNNKAKSPSSVKDWCGPISDEVEPASLKRVVDNSFDDPIIDSKRLKLNEVAEEPAKIDNEESIDIPKSGIFKKCDLKDKYPSINSMFGKSLNEKTGDSNSKPEDSKSGENQKGILKIDHTQTPELLPGIYRMSVNGSTVKIDLLANDKSLTAVLPVMPGPKGGVLVLGNKYDSSKIAKASPKLHSSPEKSAVLKTESPAFRGIFPRNKLIEDSPTKTSKPDFHSKTTNVLDSSKKPVNSSIRKVLGGTVPKMKGKTSISTPAGISRFKSNIVKNYSDSFSETSVSRLAESDGFLLEFCDLENSDSEEYALPDDFPEELNMEPLSPTRPLTLDPETGKRLMRAEGEPTPQPTPEPSPEPSPVPSPVPVQVMCKEETEGLVESENMMMKNGDSAEEGTYTEINGSTYKVTNAGQVGLLQNTTYAQDDTEMKDIAVASGLTDEESNDNPNMLTITGEDGLVYQVANAKLEGDTIVVASGEEDQQCVFVTEDGHQVMQRTNEDGSTVLTLESAYADAVAQLVPNQVNILPDGSQIYVKQEENGQVELVQIQGSEMAEQETGEQDEGQMAENADENSGQVVAQLIEAGEPAPGGGPRRVVLLLPDGNLMVTEVDEEQFAALELEK